MAAAFIQGRLTMEEEEEEEEEEELESVSSFFSEEEEEEEEDGDSVNSSSTSSSRCPPSTSSDDHDQLEEGPLFEMSSLISLLPIKRGLSKHFDGKSQSFTSLANVRSLEDLAKPERPLIKRKLNSCQSYAGGLDRHKALSPKSGAIAKRASSSASSLLNARRQSFLSHRPTPVHPQRPGSTFLLAAAEFEY